MFALVTTCLSLFVMLVLLDGVLGQDTCWQDGHL
jgi:hypothetical protein